MGDTSASSEHDDEERFTVLFRTHVAAVEAYCQRRLPAAAVDDVVAETFATAWRRLDDVPDNALPWLLRVAYNATGHHIRSTTRRWALVDRMRSNWSAEDLDPQSSVDDRERVAAAMNALRRGDQEVLLLVLWDDLPVKDAAVVLGIGANTAAARLRRARNRFRRAWSRAGETSTATSPLLAIQTEEQA